MSPMAKRKKKEPDPPPGVNWTPEKATGLFEIRLSARFVGSGDGFESIGIRYYRVLHN